MYPENLKKRWEGHDINLINIARKEFILLRKNEK